MYRTGGTLPQNVNFALKINVLKNFLDNCAETLPAKANKIENKAFDSVKNSIAQVYSGVVTEESVNQKKLICVVYYQSYWDMWYKFRFFHIEFYDLETGELLLKAGQYGPNFNTEKAAIDGTFKEIRTKFPGD
jgi:hypothetical protein